MKSLHPSITSWITNRLKYLNAFIEVALKRIKFARRRPLAESFDPTIYFPPRMIREHRLIGGIYFDKPRTKPVTALQTVPNDFRFQNSCITRGLENVVPPFRCR